MARAKPAHYRGTYHTRSAQVRRAAYANPGTRCWRCNRTLAEVRRVKPRARWQAGHLVDGMVEGPLRAECSPCNASAGAKRGNAKRRARKLRRTALTW